MPAYHPTFLRLKEKRRISNGALPIINFLEYSRTVENFRIVARYSGSVSLATAESTFGKRISPGLSGIFVQALTPVFSGQARPGSSMLNKYVH